MLHPLSHFNREREMGLHSFLLAKTSYMKTCKTRGIPGSRALSIFAQDTLNKIILRYRFITFTSQPMSRPISFVVENPSNIFSILALSDEQALF